MDVDIILEPDLSSAQVVELGVAAERYGIRAVWTSNYFAHWDGFISLVPLALATKRLKLGVLAVSPFEMHPLKIANALLSLNELAGGRAMVAIGAGEGNLDAMDLKKPPKIVRAVREAIEIVRAAANRNLGHVYNGEDFRVTYPCAYDWVKAPPASVYGTAYRVQMMRMQARVSDGVFIGCTPPEIVEPAMAAVREGIAKREPGRGPIRVNTFWQRPIVSRRANCRGVHANSIRSSARCTSIPTKCNSCATNSMPTSQPGLTAPASRRVSQRVSRTVYAKA